MRAFHHTSSDDLLDTPRPRQAFGLRTLTAALPPRAVQARSAASARSSSSPPSAESLDAAFTPHLATPTDALPAPVQAQMSAAFGADFSSVRIHQDGQAEQLGADAFASGDDLHFAPGRYDPASQAGLQLIGHELAHVVQQRTGRVSGDGLVVDAGLERAADEDGARAARGESTGAGDGSYRSTAIQGAGIKQAFPAIPTGGAVLAAMGAEIWAWAGAEGTATALATFQTLIGAAGGVVGGIGQAIAPGQSGVQAYSIQPWQSTSAEPDFEKYVQCELINTFMQMWLAQQPKAGAPTPPAGAAPAQPPVTGQPVPTPAPGTTPTPAPAPTPPVTTDPVAPAPAAPSIDPAILGAVQAAALADVKSKLAKMIQGLVKTADSTEFVWSDSGGKTSEMGTVGAVKLRKVRGFRFGHNLALHPEAKKDPVLAATGIDGARVDVVGINCGDLGQGPSWKIGYNDSLGVNVKSQNGLADGVELNLGFQWDQNETYLTLNVTVDNGGNVVIAEASREGVPDDFAWL